MPTKDNESDGNLFLNMPGGYLRVLYPAPTACLDLKAWQEFYGFDMQGQEGYFDINIDTDNLTMVIQKMKEPPKSFPLSAKKRKYVLNTEDIKPVDTKSVVPSDFYGNEITSAQRIPGPFTTLTENLVLSIDPRVL
jgi:hypothetical protein